MTTDLTFSFKVAAEGALRDHPQVNDHVLLAWVDHERCADPSLKIPLEVYGSPELCRIVAQDRPSRQFLYNTAREIGSCVTPLMVARTPFQSATSPSALLHYSRDHSPGVELAIDAEKSLSKWWTFFHEFGHVVCENGSGPGIERNTKENCADAYAALRLLQAYGDVALGFITRKAISRTMSFLRTGKTGHLTLPALTTVLQMYQADPLAVRNKSAQDIVVIADAIAESLAYTPEEQKRLCVTYRAVASVMPVRHACFFSLAVKVLHEVKKDHRLFFPGAVAVTTFLGRNGLTLKDGGIIYRDGSVSIKDKEMLAANDHDDALGLVMDLLHLTPTGRAPRPRIMGF